MPCFTQTSIIRLRPEPHCSINRSSRKTLPRTLLRNCETPEMAACKLKPKGSGPGLVISICPSKMAIWIGDR